ncbi:MAG TPA: hypothetical protein VFO67_20345 [Gemmatimonadales bacterium]|nr:hypothetical protein [Gemmatimonadales bacterium]
MPDLKPMAFGEILDGSLTIFRRHFGLFVKLGVVALWLPVSITIYVSLAGGQQQHLGLALLASLIQYFAGLFLSASAIRVISDSYLGEAPQFGDAIALGASKIWSLFVAGLAKGIILAGIGLLIFVVGAVTVPTLMAGGGSGGAALMLILAITLGGWFLTFVACGYAVTTPIVVLENLASATDSLGRSWGLTRGFKLRIFGIFFVAGLIVYLPAMVVGAVAGVLGAQSVMIGSVFEVFAAALPIVLTPLFSCVVTLLYYDLRVRREGFDLQVLSEQLGALSTGAH